MDGDDYAMKFIFWSAWVIFMLLAIGIVSAQILGNLPPTFTINLNQNFINSLSSDSHIGACYNLTDVQVGNIAVYDYGVTNGVLWVNATAKIYTNNKTCVKGFRNQILLAPLNVNIVQTIQDMIQSLVETSVEVPSPNNAPIPISIGGG